MRRLPRLTPARDRELRHVVGGHMAWRWRWAAEEWYAWCRVCGRDATKQVTWLAENGYAQPLGKNKPVTVNVLTTKTTYDYMERHPR